MQIFDYFSLTPSTITKKLLGLHKKLNIQNHGLFMGFQKNVGFFRKTFKIFFSGPKTIFKIAKWQFLDLFDVKKLWHPPTWGIFDKLSFLPHQITPPFCAGPSLLSDMDDWNVG